MMSQIDLFAPVTEPKAAMVTAPVLALLDAHNHLYRHWYSPSPRPVHEAWGCDLGRIRRLFHPTHALAVFDGDAPSWRHELYPAYKSGRPPRPEGLTEQFDLARRACEHASMRHVRVDAVEADDLIASYTKAAVGLGWEVVISSNDKDLMQLMRDAPKVRLLDHKRDLVGPAEVEQRYGVQPTQLADFLALVGDSSDAFPGVHRVGKKTAASLLKQHGSIEGILREIESKQKLNAAEQRISEAEDDVRVFRRLANLSSDLALPIALHDLRWDP